MKKFFLFTAFVLIIFSIFLFKWVKSLPIPDFQTFEERKTIQSTKIYDRTGQIILFDVYKNIKRTIIPYEEIPINIKNATVAIEDAEFYQHKGISFLGILRAFLKDVFSGQLKQGGSTITQQLVKNTLLTKEKTITRKIKEIVLSFKVERTFSKEQILALYLNEIPYGGSNYGVEAAARSFFNKPAKNLTLAESAYLASLPQAPTYYSPYGQNREKLEERKNFVLKRMSNLGFITKEEEEDSRKEKVSFANSKETGIKAPHFVMFVKQYLEEKYGQDMVENGGLKVITTLDLPLQDEIEKIVYDYSLESEKNFNAKNAGAVGIDPKTGQILIMVGSKNYFDENYDGKFNVTTAKRQPGSAFKPFVYATAFKKGYSPETVIFDLRTEFNASCNPDGTPKPGTKEEECYHPVNYDEVYRGPVSFRNALAQSINIPAVKALYLAGLNDSLQTAKDLGINTLTDPNRYGLTLVLGGGEVSLLEMTGAYSVFANNGLKNPPTAILKIENTDGDILEEHRIKNEPVLDKNIAGQITSILSDNKARTPAFGENSWLYFPGRDVAAKTGTTNDYKDAWVMGYTPNFTLGLWMGNNDNTPMVKKVSGFIAAPLWNKIFKKAFELLPAEKFEKNNNNTTENTKPVLKGYWQGGESYFIDKITKKLATSFTPKELVEEKILTQVHSILYWVDKNNPSGEKPQNPFNDPQFPSWEYAIRKWVENQGIKEEGVENIPTEYDDAHKPEYAPQIEIISPKENSTLKKDEPLSIKISPKSHFPLKKVDVFLNETYAGTVLPSTYELKIENSQFSLNNFNSLKLVAYDAVLNKQEYNITILSE